MFGKEGFIGSQRDGRYFGIEHLVDLHFLSASYFHPQSFCTYHLQQGENVEQGES
jgi:hypothetical protein